MLAIINYDAGNLTSVKRALDYLGIPCTITPDPQEILRADRVIFPGVGHAGSAMKTITARGLDTALTQVYRSGRPIMGICLGSQIILERSEEGDTPCVGLLEGASPQFRLSDPLLKIPHMGWDSINIVRTHPVLANVHTGSEFYFVHSFYPQPSQSDAVIATCEYEITFAAVIGRNNLIATQFHPEKSGPIGLQLLKNFASWDGTC